MGAQCAIPTSLSVRRATWCHEQSIVGASVTHRLAFGLNAGKKALTLKRLPATVETGHHEEQVSKRAGFSLYVGVAWLVALVPKPRTNLARYHGVFSPNSQLRKKIVPKQAIQVEAEHSAKCQFGSKR